MRGRVCVVPAGEIPVVGSDDGVLLPHFHVLPKEGATHTGSVQCEASHVATTLKESPNTFYLRENKLHRAPGTNQQ